MVVNDHQARTRARPARCERIHLQPLVCRATRPAAVELGLFGRLHPKKALAMADLDGHTAISEQLPARQRTRTIQRRGDNNRQRGDVLAPHKRETRVRSHETLPSREKIEMNSLVAEAS
jgi:hypothetical protein